MDRIDRAILTHLQEMRGSAMLTLPPALACRHQRVCGGLPSLRQTGSLMGITPI